MNLKDFSNKPIEDLKINRMKNINKKDIEDAKKLADDLKQTDANTYKNYEDAINKYSGMEENALMQEFLRVTKEQKENGTLDETQIENTYNMLYPMLNEEQRKNLDNLMKVIK